MSKRPQVGRCSLPYLFIIIADVLQRLVHAAHATEGLHHPLDPSRPCPVLQYTYDTLIICKGDLVSAYILQKILDDIAAATGLAKTSTNLALSRCT